jgi:uncharacterized protein YbjT (DUF2867 family)
MTAKRRARVTGATGCISGRLVPRLMEAGFRVWCLARDPARLEGRPWRSQVEVAAGDGALVESPARLLSALIRERAGRSGG